MEERQERSQGSGRKFGNNSGGRSYGNNSGKRSYGNRNNFQRREPSEKYKAICSECGQECEVPFKPTPGKPVYCFECFKEKTLDQEEINFF